MRTGSESVALTCEEMNKIKDDCIEVGLLPGVLGLMSYQAVENARGNI